MVQAYLPDAYYETEADPARVLLFFKRIASKTDMLIGIISQIHNLPAALNTAASEILVGVCELRGHLRHFSTLNRRFSAVISRCSTEDWLRYGKVLSEVVGVETKVDGWIALVKADEFNEGDCARDLASLIAHFDHLAETTFGRTELDVAEVQLGLAYGFDYDLDNFAAAVGFARQAVMGLASEDGRGSLKFCVIALKPLSDIEVDVGESSLEDGVYAPVQRILDLVRGVKVPSG